MKRPVIIRHKPDSAEQFRRELKRTRIAALIRKTVAHGDEAGISRDDLGRAFMDIGAALVASATDRAGAQAALGVASHQYGDVRPCGGAARAAEADLRGDGR